MARYSSLRAVRPSFLEGLARIFDLGNTLADLEYPPAVESVAEAFAHDWAMLSRDLEFVVDCGLPAET